jgi:hypothetical protein
MVGALVRIRALSEFREELSTASGKAWIEKAKQWESERDLSKSPEPLDFGPFGKVIKRGNRQLQEILLPEYRKMLALFTEQYWLAEPSTTSHYYELCRFVEIWELYLTQDAPPEALAKLQHSEERVKPLYSDLAATLTKLRRDLSGRLPD